VDDTNWSYVTTFLRSWTCYLPRSVSEARDTALAVSAQCALKQPQKRWSGEIGVLVPSRKRPVCSSSPSGCSSAARRPPAPSGTKRRGGIN
jgi:hypothetical protein